MDRSLLLYCEKLNFPKEASTTLCTAWKILSDPVIGDPEHIRVAAEKLFDGEDNGYLDQLAEIAARHPAIPSETVDMAFLLSCLPQLLDRYRKKNLPESLFWDSINDLCYKLTECRRVRGVWGTFVTDWYAGFFRLTRFAVGRLQYERRAFPATEFGGIKQGNLVCACHIPSSGPLTEESVTDSLRRAAAFFSDVRINNAFPVICHSWLLYPPIVALFPDMSNLACFAKRFEIFNVDQDPENKDAWRVFDVPFDPRKIDDLPEDTALRRSLKRYLATGNSMGNGYGIVLFDETKAK